MAKVRLVIEYDNDNYVSRRELDDWLDGCITIQDVACGDDFTIRLEILDNAGNTVGIAQHKPK